MVNWFGSTRVRKNAIIENKDKTVYWIKMMAKWCEIISATPGNSEGIKRQLDSVIASNNTEKKCSQKSITNQLHAGFKYRHR